MSRFCLLEPPRQTVDVCIPILVSVRESLRPLMYTNVCMMEHSAGLTELCPPVAAGCSLGSACSAVPEQEVSGTDGAEWVTWHDASWQRVTQRVCDAWFPAPGWSPFHASVPRVSRWLSASSRVIMACPVYPGCISLVLLNHLWLNGRCSKQYYVMCRAIFKYYRSSLNGVLSSWNEDGDLSWYPVL